MRLKNGLNKSGVSLVEKSSIVDNSHLQQILYSSAHINEQFNFFTKQFRISQTEFKIFTPSEVIPEELINHVQILRGPRSKRPLLSLVFGIILIIGSMFVLEINRIGLYDLINGYVDDWEVFDMIEFLGYWFWIFFFIFILGLTALIQAIFPVWLLKIHLENRSETFVLYELRKDRGMLELILFLNIVFGNGRVEIDQRIQNKFPDLQSEIIK